jgi:hypothetical protein
MKIKKHYKENYIELRCGDCNCPSFKPFKTGQLKLALVCCACGTEYHSLLSIPKWTKISLPKKRKVKE